MKKTKEKKKTEKKKRNGKEWLKANYKKIIIGFIILFGIFFLFYLIDTTRVIKQDKKPIFALKTGEFTDNVSEEYTGLGYKIIFYKQVGGRYDTKIGPWTMKFSDIPTKLQLIDLAIEYTDNPKDTYKKYRGEYISIKEKPYYIDEKNNVIRFQYIDEDEKYTFAVDVYLMYQIASNYKNKQVTIVGTVDNFRNKTKETPNALIIKNAFVK